MALYEHVFIARQDLSPAEVDTLRDTFKKIIQDNGGQTSREEYWGLRTLAYRIRKNRKGHYVLMNIDAPGPAVHEMERQIRLHEDVLRHLTVKVDELDENPSAMMQTSNDNKDRDHKDRDHKNRRDR